MDMSAQLQCIERRLVPAELQLCHVASGFTYGALGERDSIAYCNMFSESALFDLAMSSTYVNLIAG